jgi:multidrug efflux pump subunit AcrB
VARVRGLLPDILEPVVQNRSRCPAICGSRSTATATAARLTTLAERQIKNRLQTVAGVSSVMIGGELVSPCGCG